MKSFFCNKFLFALGLFLCVIFSSCDGDISLEVSGDFPAETLAVTFSGKCGESFSAMILAATGGGAVFDTAEIAAQLEKSGFSDVAVKSDGTSLRLAMKDIGCKSYLFSSGILSLENSGGKIRSLGVHLNAQKLADFYAACDPQIQMLLDLFLAPVFNDEKMSVDDYVQTVGAVYGAGAMSEISASKITMSIKPSAQGASKKTVGLASLLCGYEN